MCGPQPSGRTRPPGMPGPYNAAAAPASFFPKCGPLYYVLISAQASLMISRSTKCSFLPLISW